MLGFGMGLVLGVLGFGMRLDQRVPGMLDFCLRVSGCWGLEMGLVLGVLGSGMGLVLMVLGSGMGLVLGVLGLGMGWFQGPQRCWNLGQS